MDTTHLIQIYSRELKLGMYVAELDRPWLESPFLFQGFKVSSPYPKVFCLAKKLTAIE